MADGDALAAVWPAAVERLKAALDIARRTHTPDDILAGIIRGDFQLWTGERSAVVTEVVTYPRAKVLHYFLAGGDLEELKHMERIISAGAGKLGFDRATIGGRPGFLRALDGYDELCRYMVKDLS